MVRHEGLSDDAIQERISELGATSYVTESDEEGFKVGTQFESFYYQARHWISDRGLIIGFLMLWFKRCVVPSLPKEAIAIDVVYPTVLLAHSRSLRLLPTMFCSLYDLRELHSKFSKVETFV